MADMYRPAQLPHNVTLMPGVAPPMMGGAPQPVDPWTYPIEVDRGDFGLPRREIEHAKRLEQDVKTWAAVDETQFKRMKKWRASAAGGSSPEDDRFALYEQEGDGKEHVRANLTHAMFRSMLPATAARNPEVAVAPSERIADSEYARVRPFARTGEIVINHAFRSGFYKRQLRRNVLSANTTGPGWLKVTYQRDIWRDPLVQARIDDAQNNIQRMRQLVSDTDPSSTEVDADSMQVRMSELEQVARGLEEQVEIVRAEGFVFDRCRSEDLLVHSDVEEFEDYRDADAIAQQIFMPADEAREMFGLLGDEAGKRFDRAKRYMERAEVRGEGGESYQPSSQLILPAGVQSPSAQKNAFVRIFEIWSKRDRVVYTLIEGMPGWAREPYRPQKTGRRWYPFFCLSFNAVDGRRMPLSDAELIADLVEEYNDTRVAFYTHRDRAVPFRVARRGDVSEEDAKRINQAEAMELVLIDGPDDDTKPVSYSVGQIEYAPIDAALYDVAPVRQDLDQVFGSTDLWRGGQTSQRTATAAAIQNEGQMQRTTDRQDAVEDFTQEIAEYVLQVALQEMTYEQVKRICGEGTVWPGIPVQQPLTMPAGPMGQMAEVVPGKNVEHAWVNEFAREDVYDLVMVEIRAGSLGKPNRQMEQQNWMQLWPLIQQTQAEVYQLRLSLQFDLAAAKVELLKEMLRRLDERIDVERLIPDVDPQQIMMQQQFLMQQAAMGQGQQGSGQPPAGAGGQPGGAPGGLIAPSAPPAMAA